MQIPMNAVASGRIPSHGERPRLSGLRRAWSHAIERYQTAGSGPRNQGLRDRITPRATETPVATELPTH